MTLEQPASGLLPASDVLPDRTGRRAAITKLRAKSFKPAAGAAEAFLWDATMPGLGLRAYASGKKVWVLQYRDAHGRTRRLNLGDGRAVSPEEAREAARLLLAQKAVGNDPAAARQASRHGERMTDLIEAYLSHMQRRVRPNTLDHVTRNLKKYAASLHGESVVAVERASVHRLHVSLTKTVGPVQANRVLTTLGAMFSWAMKAGLAENNPAALVPKNAERTRERVLGDDELAAVWRATNSGSDYDRTVRLLLLTGCRREEIGGLRWDEIDGDRLVLPAARTKTKVMHEVPLTALASAQLPSRVDGREFVFGRGEGGFAGWSRCKSRLDRAVGQGEPWGLHDLRRTLSTRLNEAGVDPHVVEALLAHAGARSGIAGVYNRASYRAQKREAAERWTAIVEAIIRERAE